uniref:Uncharacterized protein n=1 Tax=Calidris pygmaea TaxID=425635 RepID=A0A8C3KH35_9CHAR
RSPHDLRAFPFLNTKIRIVFGKTKLWLSSQAGGAGGPSPLKMAAGLREGPAEAGGGVLLPGQAGEGNSVRGRDCQGSSIFSLTTLIYFHTVWAGAGPKMLGFLQKVLRLVT